ncbi:MAG TPA: hypothetical protein HPP51_04405 [Planctomycetes bacterium]|nr:hypothetical protein [Planctomycetota bacterium]
MITVFRKRWPEAALVIILQALLMVLLEEIAGRASVAQQNPSAALPGHMGFILGMGTTLLAIIWQMLYLGFLATACSQDAGPRQPAQLVSIGRLFFWRMLRFQILLGVIYIGISFVILAVVQSVVLASKQVSGIPDWVVHLCSFAALVVLAKPMLFIPAVMIVRDRMVLEAVGLLKEYRFFEAKDLVRAFFLCFAAVYLLSFFLGMIKPNGAFYYAAVGLYAVVSSALIVAVTLAAVIFVAGKTKPATEPAEPVEDNLTAD